MKLKRILILTMSPVFLSLFCGLSALAMTDLQERMSRPPTERQELSQRMGLIRLWTFEDRKNMPDDVVMGNGHSRSGSLLINKALSVYSRDCKNKSYAYFNNGMIESDETLVIEKILTEVKPSDLDQNLVTTKKVWDHLKINYPNVMPSSAGFNPSFSDKILKVMTEPERRNDLKQSTSLIEIKETQRKGEYIINSTDYSVGGWFKPDMTPRPNSSGQMTLFTKKFMNEQGLTNGHEEVEEWRIFISGNEIFFHNFRDSEKPSIAKYLSPIQALKFRAEHYDYYAQSEYYADVLEKPVLGETLKVKALPLPQLYSDLPILPQGKKPIPPIGVVPVPSQPVAPPVVIPGPPPRPPGTPPFAPYPNPIVISPGAGKEYTARVDMKRFWWAASLGSCYSCETLDEHRDAWYYISFSVHLNDPLGPYVDLMVIQDPNARIFGSKATLANNLKTARWELDRDVLSRQALNPVQHTARLEKGCTSATCVKSVLEIGNISQNNGYNGYMRGVYLAKKSLRQKDVLDMAAQFYPDDSELCTYSHAVHDSDRK